MKYSIALSCFLCVDPRALTLAFTTLTCLMTAVSPSEAFRAAAPSSHDRSPSGSAFSMLTLLLVASQHSVFDSGNPPCQAGTSNFVEKALVERALMLPDMRKKES